ncbi:MAG TPA: NADH-quinone oxidoreductase subunit C [Candidatus Paceibacterota bacterium]|nr:NADH-quinone oxidoreductase subunit C [Verrucomicrobiota bacterium]HRY49226.1 NADH-quinone oxidoreductase subunit C [Candidatus Paceibacterota bacterium]
MSAPSDSPLNTGSGPFATVTSPLRDELQKLLGEGAVFELSGSLPAFRVAPSELHAAAAKVKVAGFDYLLLVTAVDYPAQGEFELVYALSDFRDGREFCLLTRVPRDCPRIETVSDLWPTADWHEREVYDLFGVRFDRHPDLRRILLDDTWEGYPLRKDYVDTVHDVRKRPY